MRPQDSLPRGWEVTHRGQGRFVMRAPNGRQWSGIVQRASLRELVRSLRKSGLCEDGCPLDTPVQVRHLGLSEIGPKVRPKIGSTPPVQQLDVDAEELIARTRLECGL